MLSEQALCSASISHKQESCSDSISYNQESWSTGGGGRARILPGGGLVSLGDGDARPAGWGPPAAAAPSVVQRPRPIRSVVSPVLAPGPRSASEQPVCHRARLGRISGLGTDERGQLQLSLAGQLEWYRHAGKVRTWRCITYPCCQEISRI
jgi:hypothetical protein